MELVASKREIKGKKVRFLRRQGITPVNLSGHNVEPMTLQCDTKQLRSVLTRTGKTGLVNLIIDGLREPRSVMFREVQIDPITGEMLHVDLYQVNMNEKVRVEVPIVTIGEAPALKLKENYLARELNSLVLECLPARMPSRVEVDISSLTEAGQAIHVKDINLGEGVTILNNPEQAVVKINVRFVEKEAPEAAAPAETAEAEAPAEGEAKKEEGAAAA